MNLSAEPESDIRLWFAVLLPPGWNYEKRRFFWTESFRNQWQGLSIWKAPAGRTSVTFIAQAALQYIQRSNDIAWAKAIFSKLEKYIESYKTAPQFYGVIHEP